jgi:hypothetical protein
MLVGQLVTHVERYRVQLHFLQLLVPLPLVGIVLVLPNLLADSTTDLGLIGRLGRPVFFVRRLYRARGYPGFPGLARQLLEDLQNLAPSQLSVCKSDIIDGQRQRPQKPQYCTFRFHGLPPASLLRFTNTDYCTKYAYQAPTPEACLFRGAIEQGKMLTLFLQDFQKTEEIP